MSNQDIGVQQEPNWRGMYEQACVQLRKVDAELKTVRSLVLAGKFSGNNLRAACGVLGAEQVERDPNGKSALDVQVGGNHYKDMKIQPVEFCHANNIPFLEANVIKYICRHASKDGRKDLEKAKHYIDLLIKMSYENVAASPTPNTSNTLAGFAGHTPDHLG